VSGVTSTQTFGFFSGTAQDLPSGFAIEIEHFDFDSGQQIPAVNTMPYTGDEYNDKGAVHNVDYHQPDNVADSPLYRIGENPNVPMDAQTAAGTADVVRPGGWEVTTNYKIGWAGSDWYNFSRTIPNGNYKIYAAQSHGDPFGTAGRIISSYGIVTAGKGTQNQTVAMIGSYNQPATGGWGDNAIVPVQTGGKDTIVHLSGNTTIRVFVDSGDYDWFALVPTTEPSIPVVSSTIPANGATALGALSFNIVDQFRDQTLNLASIKLSVNGQDVTSGLQVSDTPEGATVKYGPVAAGAASYSLTFASSGGVNSTNTGSFTSIGGNAFIIEAEDFNFDGGQTKPAASTMPLTGPRLYAGLGAVTEVDYHVIGNEQDPGAQAYRTNEAPNVPINENNGDLNRGSFDLSANYKIGWIDSGEWFNYTRTFPNSSFNVYAAISHGDAGPTSGSLQLVTGDITKTNQAVTELGTFNTAGGTGGWGANRFVPLKDGSGNLASVALNGNQTVRFTAGSGDYDYLVFVTAGPPDTNQPPTIAISGVTNGQVTITASAGTIEGSDALGTTANWQPVGTGTTATVPTSGRAKFFRAKK
jgi:hypothetical protein